MIGGGWQRSGSRDGKIGTPNELMEDEITLIRRNELMEGRTKLGLMMIKVMEDLLLRMLCLGLDILLGVSLLIVLLGLDIPL